MQEIHKYYMNLRANDHLSNPVHDYPRLINKLTFTLYREMIEEYETNIKPQMLDASVKEMQTALLTARGLEVEYKEAEGYTSITRFDEDFEYELRLLNFVDRLDTDKDDETAEEQKKLNAEPNGSTDERYFFKYGKNFVSPDAAPHYTNMIKDHLANKKEIVANPFSRVAITDNLLEVEIHIRNLKTENSAIVKGYILD